jgi:hypothetical protein
MDALVSAPFAGLGDVSSLAKRIKAGARAKPYTHMVAFSDVTVSAGGDASERVTIQSDADFAVQQIQVTARLASSEGSSVAGTPLPYDSHPGSEHNELPTMELVRLYLQDNDLPWMNDPVPATIYGGNVANPGFVLASPILSARNSLTVKVYNDSAEDLKIRVGLVGLKLYGNA